MVTLPEVLCSKTSANLSKITSRPKIQNEYLQQGRLIGKITQTFRKLVFKILKLHWGKNMKTLILSVILAGFIAANAQQQPAIRPLLQAIAMGKTDEVRKKLPDLLVEYPDDPGIQYLHAVLLEDAAKATPLFERIVKNYPTSEWADDAQWRIVQYYAMKKDTARARTELTVFRTKYPQSEFLLAATDAVKFTVDLPKSANKQSVAPKESIAVRNSAEKPAAKSAATIVASAKKTVVDNKKNKSDAVVANNAKPSVNNAKNTNENTVRSKVAIAIATPPPSHTDAKDKNITNPTKTPKEKPAFEKAQSSVSAIPPAAEHDNAKDIDEATFEQTASSSSLFSLQVGSYTTKEQAENEANNFHQKRFRAIVSEKRVQGVAKFAVYIGEYSSRNDAEKARVIVEKQCNCKPFIVSRRP